MRNKGLLVFLMAFVAIVLTVNAVLASDIATITEVRIDGITASTSSPVISGEVANTIPVDVEFVANQDVTKVRVEVSIDGYKEDISAETSYFLIVNGSKYVKRFSLKLPSTMDLDDLREGAMVHVEISAKGEVSVEEDYPIELQRTLYGLSILSIDAPDTAMPGSTVTLDVVIQNNGDQRLDNAYVKASIPELGIERKVWLGDLEVSYPEEETTEDIADTTGKKILLTIPRNALPGTYNVIIEAYNYDTSVTTKKALVVSNIQSGVLPSGTTKTIAPGEETSFDVVLVNPNDRMVVYTVTPEEAKGLAIEVSDPVVAVSADSSRTVKVTVKATQSAEEGSHLVTIDVNSETGLVKQVGFNVNVVKDGKTTTGGSTSGTTSGFTAASPVFILTVVLVVIFVVLLIVLIVLLSKRPAESEEFGETSYY